MKLLPDFINDTASPPAKAVGSTLADIWNLTIGNHFSLWVKKQEVRQKKNLEDYIKRIESKTQSIPEQFLNEPQLHILGPAIEASKYFIDSDKLREMFANLIASSIDIRKIQQTHPAFVEIIKQLSPLDAEVLILFKERTQLPLAEIKVVSENKGYIITQTHVMNILNKNNYKIYASSLTNLKRLGLLSIDYNTFSKKENAYSYVKDHPAFTNAQIELKKIKEWDPSFTKVDINKGLCTRTPLCEDFISVCL